MPVALVVAVGFAVLFVSGGARFAVGLIFKPMVDDLGWAPRFDLPAAAEDFVSWLEAYDKQPRGGFHEA